jgi:anti-sigma regulatory factor (Ser/Thr protein kinase)
VVVYIYLSSKRIRLANILLILKLFLFVVVFSALFSRLWGEIGVWHGFWAAELLTFLSALLLSGVERRRKKDLSPLFLINRSSEKNGAYRAFSVLPNSESISACTDGISDFARQNEMSPKETMRIALALEELLVLINTHSQPQNTNVRMLVHDDLVILRLRCIGKRFNPLLYAQTCQDDMDVMGVKLVMKFAISLDYQETFGVNNTTILLEKKRTQL